MDRGILNIYSYMIKISGKRTCLLTCSEIWVQTSKVWDESSKTGADWFSAYMKRNPTLSIRSAEATSLAWATSFNKNNVAMFFRKFEEVIRRHNLIANYIWNVDETGITTVQTPDRVIAKRGTKQVEVMTSGERGSLVSVACAVNAIGNTIPPMFVFPRIRYADHFVRDGPVGSIGSGNKSGWMQEADFIIFLKHFANHIKVNPEKKVLLIMDNPISHLSIAATDFCKNNVIVMLTFPPHCSHKLQPLDRTVYGPLKKMVNSASKNENESSKDHDDI